jgi:SAM-dependent methyltransferase
MELADAARAALMDAGAASLVVNAPMDSQRANLIAAYVAAAGSTMLDLGCGGGWLACRTATRHPSVTVAGVDLDAAAIERGRLLAAEQGVADRVHLEVADASTLVTTTETAVCIGASHAFGDVEAMLRALHDLATVAAVVGDGIWQAEPGEDHVAMFGELPSGVGGLATIAEECGWSVVDADVSTIAEWDRFETGWGNGVRRVGTPAAAAFADHRWSEYLSYRGVLGFGWLYLATGQ